MSGKELSNEPVGGANSCTCIQMQPHPGGNLSCNPCFDAARLLVLFLDAAFPNLDLILSALFVHLLFRTAGHVFSNIVLSLH